MAAPPKLATIQGRIHRRRSVWNRPGGRAACGMTEETMEKLGGYSPSGKLCARLRLKILRRWRMESINTRAEVAVVCALIEDATGRLLLAQRPPGKALAGFWEFPGGKIEPGETPEHALARELREELGAEPALGAALRPVTFDYPALRVRLLPYAAYWSAALPPPVGREGQVLRWVRAEKIDPTEMPPADAPILAEWLARRA
jgi:8-oxo-dGTP diphosphatase